MSIRRDESHRAAIVAGFVQSSVGTSAWRIADGWNIGEAQMQYKFSTNTVYANCAFDRRSGRSPQRPETSRSRAIG